MTNKFLNFKNAYINTYSVLQRLEKKLLFLLRVGGEIYKFILTILYLISAVINTKNIYTKFFKELNCVHQLVSL